MKQNKFPLIVGAVIVIIWVVIGFGPLNWLPGWQERSAFGDMFGAASSLFSALAFGGLIYTVALQRQELALQREELKMTREELKRTASAQEDASKALAMQIKMMAYAAQITGVAAQLESHNTLMMATVTSQTAGVPSLRSEGILVIEAAQRRTRELEGNISELNGALSGLLSTQN